MVLLIVSTTYLIYDTTSIKKNEFDIVNKENPKLISIFNNQLQPEIARYKSGWYPGAIATAYIRIEDFFKSVRQIETYTTYGFGSSLNHNGIEIKITYNDGRVVENIYTGIHWNGRILMGPHVLLKMEFENGELLRVYTNGVEMSGSPDDMKNPMQGLVESLIHHDMKENRDLYFYPDKTAADIGTEWDSAK